MSDDNPFEADPTAPVIQDAEVDPAGQPPVEDKPKRKRRTKAEIEADKQAEADDEADDGATSYDGEISYDVAGSEADDDQPKTPLSEYYDGATSYDAVSNEVSAGIKLHNGIPVAWFRPKNWVGEDPLVLGLEQLRDVQAVAGDLIAQLQGATA